MGREDLKERKARFRRIVIEPLIVRGMRKRKSITAESHAEALEQLTNRLAYLSEESCHALAEVIARAAEAETTSKRDRAPRARDCWPSDIAICNWACAIQAPPPSLSHAVRSIMASRLGREAWERSPEHAQALFGYLREYGPPPPAIDTLDMRVADIREGLREATLVVEAGNRTGNQSADYARAYDHLKAWDDRKKALAGLIFPMEGLDAA